MLTVTRHTDYAARILLHLAERGPEVRATAREIAELRGIPEPDHLLQRVPDHRVGEPCRDIPDAGPFFLCLLHAGVHEHGAARAEPRRAVRGKRALRDLLDRAIKRSGKVIEVEAIRAVEAKAKAIEVKPPVEPTVARSGPIPDRRFRRA